MSSAYAAGIRVDVDGPPKRPQQTDRLLHSAHALSPLLYVGCSDGTLRSYVVDERAGCVRWQADHKRLFHACCAFLDVWGVFITLLDNRLKLYDLPLHSNALAVARDDTKGAVLFAVHEEAKTLCVLVKSNTLKVFDWTVNRILELRAQHELQTLPQPVQQLVVLSESHVFVQGKKDWMVFNVDSGRVMSVSENVKQQVDDALEGAGAVCNAVPLPSRYLVRQRQHVMDVLLCGNYRGVILSIDEELETVGEEEDVYEAFDNDTDRLSDRSAGKALDLSAYRLTVKTEKVIAYDAAPRGVFYHHPFLLLDQTEQIAVYNFGSLQMVQTIPVKKPYGVCAVSNVVSVIGGPSVTSFQYGHDRPATLFTVSPPFEFQSHQMLSIPQQVAASLGNRRLEDAVALCKLCPEESPLSDADQRKLYADYGFELFRSARRQEAMNFFFESELDVVKVLLLFPRNLLPRKTSALYKDNNSSNKKEQVLEGDDLVEGLLALIGFLRRKRNVSLQYKQGLSAIEMHTSRSLGPSEESTLELVDTMLVKCLVVVSEKAEYKERANRTLLKVVTSQNWCEISEAEIFLRAHRRFKALLAFYSARKLHRKALELLEDLERSAASAAEKNETDENEEQRQGSGDLQSSHDYMVLIAQYLRVLGKKHAELVFEFSRRVLSVNPALGLSIFTQREVPISKTDIDPAAVLQHLKSCSVATSSSELTLLEGDIGDTAKPSLPLISSQMLAIEYLTQLTYEGTRQLTPRLHDEVVYLLLDSIQAKAAQEKRLTSRVEAQRGATGLLRRKLLHFLEFPGAIYHPERMLSRTPIEMVDEHAALLSKLGRHYEVLQLYALQLKDAVLAEAYCNRCYESKTADSSIYSMLLKIYLRPQYHPDRSAVPGTTSSVVSSTSKPPSLWRSKSSGLQSEAVNAAINLLNKYAERIDVSTALELLPADVAAEHLAEFFRRVLERQVQRYRNGQVKKQLSKMENFKVREQLSTKRKESVTVWSSQCCQSCGKRLGVGTFVRLPIGTLLHYSCQPVS